MHSALGDYHNDTVRELNADQNHSSFEDAGGEAYDASSDLAVTLLVSAGLTHETLDAVGDPVSDDVQTLLMLAMFRCPALRDMLEKAEQLYSMNIAQSVEGKTYNTA